MKQWRAHVRPPGWLLLSWSYDVVVDRIDLEGYLLRPADQNLKFISLTGEGFCLCSSVEILEDEQRAAARRRLGKDNRPKPSLRCRRLAGIERGLAGFELKLRQAGVEAILGDKGRMRAFLDHPAVVEDKNPVGPEDCRQPVRDDKGRAFRHHFFERGLNHDFVFGIERGSRFVEKQHRRLLP